jgi:hypothetical protein
MLPDDDVIVHSGTGYAQLQNIIAFFGSIAGRLPAHSSIKSVRAVRAIGWGGKPDSLSACHTYAVD